MSKHLCYNAYVASYESTPGGSIADQIKSLGISYQHVTPQPMADSVWFWNCENVPEDLPKYISHIKLDPMKCIGWGLSEEDAKKIKNYKIMKGKFFRCDCGSEGLWVEYDGYGSTEFSLFHYNPQDRSWHNRIRLAWQSLKGKPYTDMMLLNDQRLADLVDHLADIQNRDQK